MKGLRQEIQDIESDAFKGFCKNLKVKNIYEYEAKSNVDGISYTNDGGQNIFDKKRDLE